MSENGLCAVLKIGWHHVEQLSRLFVPVRTFFVCMETRSFFVVKKLLGDGVSRLHSFFEKEK
jgi:hypothetical protein